MGALCAGEKADPAATKLNREIDAELRKADEERRNEIRILLLGAGESGKSTFAKQMKVLHLHGYSHVEMEEYALVVVANALTALKRLAARILESEKSRLDEELRARLLELMSLDSIAADSGQKFAAILEAPSCKHFLASSKRFTLPDSAPYFLANIKRIFEPHYVPTVEDVLRARQKTTGAHEIVFTLSNTRFRIVDVGGQRSERRKWIPLFTDVTSVIFFASLSEVNMRLEEDRSVNRLLESLQLFDEIVNSTFFLKTPVMLFLNKNDLFQEKMKTLDLKELFPEYNGGKNPEAARKFILDQFLALNRTSRQIYPHVTVATDTSNVDFVFTACKDIILRHYLTELEEDRL